ncbi:endonuclease/exonuclease/phosphatase family protein [Notoacmeibacter sp. MSK16QG-6]|uniref:endonuclease/exonuclease/phosphatase family protein n=1 Tax=Notoacmeibacter sp. MSK16QG-6 TaxID=2957982 RepID=UPI00209F4C5E|nr:endonuclease/exonuclease/phosphatase family protein [Notoacmeibacter sp. MSK16QG-6]MCP1199632.1 endonuclease/exonuclease/phosphatase family protein [Notoacmeibacter sp. MSK16QG-6]
MGLRLATFNIENLMSRFDFAGFRNALRQDRALSIYQIDDQRQYEALEAARAVATTDDTRQLSALAMAAVRADVICLQEVDNLEALDAFERHYLYRMIGRGYRQRHVSRGNDGRGIDIAVLARDETGEGQRIEIRDIQTHAFRTVSDFGLQSSELAEMGVDGGQKLFRRDCVVVDMAVGGRPFTLVALHLKSMGPSRDPDIPGREWTMPMRRAELAATRQILTDKFDGGPERMRWAICGDLNDYRERIVIHGEFEEEFRFEHVREADSSLDVLLEDGFAFDPTQKLDPMQRWTLFHSRGPGRRHLCQLDYILLSPKLAKANPDAVPQIERRGQPWRTIVPPGQEVERFPRTGWDRPKASDHCPIALELNI